VEFDAGTPADATVGDNPPFPGMLVSGVVVCYEPKETFLSFIILDFDSAERGKSASKGITAAKSRESYQCYKYYRHEIASLTHHRGTASSWQRSLEVGYGP